MMDKLPRRENIMVRDLIPGDVIRIPILEKSATYVGQLQHPIYTNLQLVIMREGNRNVARGQWFHDALHLDQVVGVADPSSEDDRMKSLRWALEGWIG